MTKAHKPSLGALFAVLLAASLMVAVAQQAQDEQDEEISSLADRLGELQEELELLRGELGHAPLWDRAGLSVQPRIREFAAAREAGFEPGVTPWQDQPLPDDISTGLESPGAALLALAGALGQGEALGADTWETTFRVLVEGHHEATGVILAWGFKDDAVMGSDLRVRLERDEEGWRITGLERRLYCARGVDGGLCL